MGADVERIPTGFRQVHELWANMLEIGLALWLIQRQLNLTAFAPLAVILGCTFGAIIIGSKTGPTQKLWLDAIQKRISATATMFGAMKGVKMTGLTDHLSKTISESSKAPRVLLVKIVSLCEYTIYTEPNLY